MVRAEYCNVILLFFHPKTMLYRYAFSLKKLQNGIVLIYSRNVVVQRIRIPYEEAQEAVSDYLNTANVIERIY